MKAGERYGRLTAVRFDAKARWSFVCDCGASVTKLVSNVRSGQTSSCGCLRREERAQKNRDKIRIQPGDKFNLLTALQLSDCGSRRTKWRFRCDCGREIHAGVTDVTRGDVKSCGCLHRKHGMSQSGEFIIWRGMIARCENPKTRCYESYGGRGIKVCPEWRHDFATFFAHVGPRPSSTHTIDRLDNDRDYEPGNVRWATSNEQQRNKRNTIRVDYQGRNMALSDAADLAGVNRETARYRFYKGLPIEEVLSR
jgi:hypothetical protein